MDRSVTPGNHFYRYANGDRTGAAYDNRFVSIVTIKNRKIVRRRDYMDSLAAWQELTGK